MSSWSDGEPSGENASAAAAAAPVHRATAADLKLWTNCIGSPVVAVDNQTLAIRFANVTAESFFGRDVSRLAGAQLADLVGEKAGRVMTQIWSIRARERVGEPFVISAIVREQVRRLIVHVSNMEVEGAMLRLYSFRDAPPEGTTSIVAWQEQILELLNWLPFGFEIADRDDQIQFANSEFTNLFGYTQDQLEDVENWWRLAYPDPAYRQYARSKWYDEIAAARAEGREIVPFDLEVTTARGDTRTIQFRHRTIGNFNINLYLDVTRERAYASEMKRLAETDALTGLDNRRSFFEKAEARFAAGDAGPQTILMLDIDHFKTINDRYGHAIGDDVLTAFGNRSRTIVGSRDLAARFGGEEFVMLFDGAAPAAAEARAEALRALLAAAPLEVDGHAIRTTVSIGLAHRLPGELLDKTLLRADRALYRAKHEGRNRVMKADDTIN